MKQLLFIAFGGMAGSVSRYLVQQMIIRNYSTIFPWGTFMVNIAGSLIIGMLFGLAAKYDWLNQDLRLLLVVGFCGSFTTFSAFAFEGLELLKNGQYAVLLTYIALSLVIGILAVWLGFILFRP
jgi:CrcB protein